MLGGETFLLTTGQDVFNGTEGNDLVRGVAGQAVGTQDQTTLNSSDILKGGAGADTLILLLNGAYGGGATIRDFETLQLGTNNALASFDYNVNQGAYEITGTNTIVFDQITAGETLLVNNITPTAADGKAPELVWANEAGATAGTISATYRQATTAGTADNQSVTLKNVNALAGGAAVMNIGAGMEKITITSTGSVAQNALNDNGSGADVSSGASLRTVVLKGDVAIGKAGGVIAAGQANAGQTNRVANGGTDLGLTTADAASTSNLLSVANVVTTVDASDMTAAANVRFTNATASDVTFKGGKGNDYVEFQLGNVTATGGEGDDTFAFINAGANSTFGEGDKIDGGAGNDTIQLGLNGVGTYNVSETELRNKTSIETLDLRGNVNNLTLSSDFVAASGTPGTVTVRTDKIVQTSAADSSNAVGNASNGLENGATSTIDLTKLSSSQGVNFLGGSGSDRIILNDAAFNVQQVLDGGTPSVDTNVGAGRYDTITITTSGGNVVIDAADLSNVKNFEGFVLTKNSAAATYNITLTRNFLNANTQAADNANTSILDTNFQIGTSNAANNSALAAGDTVTIDVRDLLNAADNGRAGGFTVRTFDITALENAGVNVVFVGNTGNLTAAQVRAAGVLVANGADANFGHVVVGSAANPSALAPLFFQGTAADESVTLIAAGNSVNMGGGSDTVNTGLVMAPTGNLDGGTGIDTLNAANGVNLSGATITNFETLNLNGAASLTTAQYNGFTTVTAGGPADAITLTDAGAITGTAAVETYNLSAAGNQITLAGNAVQAINGGAGADTVVATGATIANKTIALAGGADTLTVNGLIAATANLFTLQAAGVSGAAVSGVETVNFNGGLINGTGVLQMFNGAATVNLAGILGDTAGTDALQLGTGGQTVKVTGADGYTLAGGTGADTYDLSGVAAGAAGSVITVSGANVAFLGANANGAKSLVTNFDTIVGFRAGVDKIDSAVAGGVNQLTTINVAGTVNTGDLAGALNNAVAQAIALNAVNWDASGDALLVNITTGTATGTYYVQNAAADVTFDAGAELVIKLVGTVGVFTQADVV